MMSQGMGGLGYAKVHCFSSGPIEICGQIHPTVPLVLAPQGVGIGSTGHSLRDIHAKYTGNPFAHPLQSFMGRS